MIRSLVAPSAAGDGSAIATQALSADSTSSPAPATAAPSIFSWRSSSRWATPAAASAPAIIRWPGAKTGVACRTIGASANQSSTGTRTNTYSRRNRGAGCDTRRH